MLSVQSCGNAELVEDRVHASSEGGFVNELCGWGGDDVDEWVVDSDIASSVSSTDSPPTVILIT